MHPPTRSYTSCQVSAIRDFACFCCAIRVFSLLCTFAAPGESVSADSSGAMLRGGGYDRNAGFGEFNILFFHYTAVRFFCQFVAFDLSNFVFLIELL